MKIGNLVTFNKTPSVNTPGAPSSAQPGVGTVVKERYEDGVMFKGRIWCDVLWPNGQVTKCYKKDLSIIL
jgi:hypothetical protein